MLETKKQLFNIRTLKVVGFFLTLLLLLLLLSVKVVGQNQNENTPTPKMQKIVAEDNEMPLFRDYKGVTIDTSAEEARQKLGEPTSMSDVQDFYLITDQEMVQIFYDKSKRVMAISINYQGDKAPTCKAVLGVEAKARADSSSYMMVEYPKVGYWVSYSRTAGDAPMITVTMKKI